MSWQHKTISFPNEQEIIAELIEANQRLESEKESLEAMVLQQRDFIAKAVHEARCHVRGILLGLSILFQIKNDPEKEAEYGSMLYSLKESALKYKNLLYNLTDYSFNEYGRKIIVKRETVPVNEYLQNITKEFNYYLSELGYTLHVQLTERSFEAVLDTMKFRQVVHSLLINATQHGERGIINMAAYVDPFAGTWNLAISNPYKQQVHDEANRNANLGLGLVISKQLIEHMGGNIDILRERQLFTATIRMPSVAGNTNG